MRNICSIQGCESFVVGQNLCRKHYMRQRRTGATELLDRTVYCECGEPTVGRGLCERHYRQQRRAEAAPALHAEIMALREGRKCVGCGEPIPLERSAKATFCSYACKTKAMNERARQRPGTAEMMRVVHYRRKYAITVEDYDRMLAAQEGQCAICKTTDPKGRGRFHVDHDHVTGRVRGLLCTGCNTGLGHFKDDPSLLKAALEYLAGSANS